MVLEDGRIIERGNHDELLALGGMYSRLNKVQTESNLARDLTLFQ